MNRTTTRGFHLAGAALALPLAAMPAAAQDNGGVAEIVVTAQRQAESVLDVPLSIQALGSEQLNNAGIRQMSDLQMTTPGFVPSNSSGYNQMFIRGIGNSIFVGADPSVATFIDEVPRVFGSMVNNFFDVERVEVIKGAPGALYGRNATGGAVNIITRQPSTEALAASARFSFGEKQTVQASGYVNVPLGDTAAWSFTAERRSHDPYIKNITPTTSAYTAAMFPGGSALGDAATTAAIMNSGLVAKPGYVNEDFWSVGSKLLFRPSDRFKITLAGDYSRKDDDNGNGLYNLTPGYAVAVLSGFFNNFLGAQTTPATLAPLATLPTKKFTTAQRGEGYVRLRDYGVSGTAVLSLDALDITSITAFRENKSRFLTELGFTPFNFLAANVDINKQTFYQELRAVSTGEGPLHYIAGASYLRAKFAGGLLTNLLTPIIMGVPSGAGRYTVKNLSAYLQLSYDVSDNLNVMVSGRYIHEKNDAASFDATGAAVPVALKEKKFLPAATIKYELDGGGNIYARWARGFKAGGIVPVVPVNIYPDPFTQGGIFKGEEVDSYEVGVRTSLFGNKAQLTAAVFYNDYQNVQVAAHARPAYPTASISVVNAGSARTYGAEASLVARVADPLTVGASIGYLNAKYKSLRVVNNPVLEDFDLSGKRMINSPEWQLSVHADLDQPVSETWRAIGNVLVSYTDDVLWQQSGVAGFLPDAVGPSYWLVNARLGLRAADDQVEFAVYAKNLFNQGYTVFGNSAASYGNILAWGDPRIVGFETTLKF
jgi:iron complex outermembrane receptor protein